MTLHNITFYLDLVKSAREEILNNNFDSCFEKSMENDFNWVK